MTRWILVAPLLLLAPGCGEDPPPPWPVEDSSRAALVAEAAREAPGAPVRDEALATLFRHAEHDPVPFLRGKALEAIYERRPEGELPPGARKALLENLVDVPDYTRRQAARVLVHYLGERALPDVAPVHAETGNPRTRAAVAAAVADRLPAARIGELQSHPDPAVRGLVRAAADALAARDAARQEAVRRARHEAALEALGGSGR